ncbi:hypothetical protein [Vibrio alginolyticus]|nr:hypothetical protein [Vibrio alginolyticus]MCR9352110.1 hypothetical protein [Vibrio alginolyticus]MCR9362545.1 hypothetical protein [Vibrio alginolyticus]
MNKSPLVDHITHTAGISKAKAGDALASLRKEFECDEVALIDFGTFQTQ